MPIAAPYLVTRAQWEPEPAQTAFDKTSAGQMAGAIGVHELQLHALKSGTLLCCLGGKRRVL